MPQREPIKIHPRVREQLRDLLLSHHFEGTGAGYTAVVLAAVNQARMSKDFREKILVSQHQVNHLDNQIREEASVGGVMMLREILRAWALGETDKLHALMHSAFLQEFGSPADRLAYLEQGKSEVSKLIKEDSVEKG